MNIIISADLHSQIQKYGNNNTEEIALYCIRKFLMTSHSFDDFAAYSRSVSMKSSCGRKPLHLSLV